jgi:hypothetical protein
MRVPTDVVRSGKRIARALSPRERRCFKSNPHCVVFPHRSTPSKTMKAPRWSGVTTDFGEGIIWKWLSRERIGEFGSTCKSPWTCTTGSSRRMGNVTVFCYVQCAACFSSLTFLHFSSSCVSNCGGNCFLQTEIPLLYQYRRRNWLQEGPAKACSSRFGPSYTHFHVW